MPPPSSTPGIASRAEVFGDGPELPGQVFAMELLERPIVFERSGGRLRVRVDRRGVRDAVYTGRGKAELLARYVGEDELDRSAALARDLELHRFLLGTAGDGRFVLDQRGMRWSSGGVLARIRWRGQRWIAYAFRDIPPFGWNVSLGGSDRGDDLDRPLGIGAREFLEETAVVRGTSARVRPILLGDGDARTRCEVAGAPHFALRAARDGLPLALAPPGADDLVARVLPTRNELVVTSDAGEAVTQDILVCVNVLELGIEIVRVVELDLDDDDGLLDGEILHPAGEDGPELIRMPVALVRESALARELGPCWTTPRLDSGVPPSVVLERLDADELHLFERDVERRRAVTDGDDPTATGFERARYGGWRVRFGRWFYGADAGPCPLFTLPSAKLTSYAFAELAS